MKQLVLFFVLVIATTIATPVAAVDVSIDTAVNSKYIWRGIVLNDHPVFQPSFTVENQGFAFNVWGNMDLTDDYDHEFEFNEIDYTMSYSQELPSFGWSAGLASYTFPNTDFASTTEFFAGISLSTIQFNPSATLYYDFDEVEAFYLELTGSHDFECGVSFGLLLGYGSSDYIDAYFVTDGSSSAAFTHYAASLDYPVTLHLGELNFNMTYTNLADSNIHSPGFESDDGNLVVGASWSYSF